jgi:NADH:ubiquinone oxidoreductase subunit E
VSLLEQPETAAKSIAASELLEWYISRIHRYVEEAPELESVPMLAKAQTVAALIQAQALDRIAGILASLRDSGVRGIER